MFAKRPCEGDSDRGSCKELYSCGTYITQDCERFSQRFTQQPDPFGKQLVQMFAKMLTDNDRSGKDGF